MPASWLAPLLPTLLLGFGDPVYVDQYSVEEDVSGLLSDERYEFCDVDGDFEPSGRETMWCGIAEESSRCPGWVTACTRAEPWSGDLEELFGRFGRGGGGDGGGSSDGSGSGAKEEKTALNPFAGHDDPPEPEPEPELKLPDMSGLAQFLMWTLAILFAAWLIWTILQRRVERDDEDERLDADDDPVDDGGGPSSPRVEERKVIETDVERLLRRARERAQNGEHREAIDDTYAALVRRLEGEGLIEIHSSLTNGDYLNRLRPRPQLRSEVGSVIRDVEKVQFGDAPPDGPTFQRIFDRVAPLARRSLTALAFLLTVAATSLACPGTDNPFGDTDEHAGLGGLGKEPLGARLLVQTLRRNDFTAHHRMRTVDELTSGDSIVLLFGDVDLLEDEWDQLLEWVEEGHTLVIATGGWVPDALGWESVPDYEPAPAEPQYDTWGEPTGEMLEVEDEVLAIAGESVWEFEYLAVRTPRERRLEQRSGATSWQPMLYRGPDVYAIDIQRGDGEVLLFADDELFTNISLATSDNAFYVVRILADRNDEVEVVNYWIGRGADTPFEAVRNSNMLPFLLQLLAFMLLLFLLRGAAFATLRDPPARSRRAFADHVDALGMQYAKARASRFALGLYAGFVFERIRERVQTGPASSGGGLHAMAQAIAMKTGRDESEVMRILVEAYDARNAVGGRSDVKDDLRLMRELQRLLDEVSGRRR